MSCSSVWIRLLEVTVGWIVPAACWRAYLFTLDLAEDGWLVFLQHAVFLHTFNTYRPYSEVNDSLQ